MQAVEAKYFAEYRSLKLERDASGVLVSRFTVMAGRSLSRRRITLNLSMRFTGSRRIERTRSSF